LSRTERASARFTCGSAASNLVTSLRDRSSLARAHRVDAAVPPGAARGSCLRARRVTRRRSSDRRGGGDLAELDALDRDALSARGERQWWCAGAASLDLIAEHAPLDCDALDRDALAELVATELVAAARRTRRSTLNANDSRSPS
jgi:hypothetical protein